MEVSFRSALEAVRGYVIRNTDFSEGEVTLNQPNIEGKEKNICLYLSGFSIPETPKPPTRRVFLKIEMREKIDISTNRQFEDVLEDASKLAVKLRSAIISGISLTPLDDGSEGNDPEYENVYIVSFSMTMNI